MTDAENFRATIFGLAVAGVVFVFLYYAVIRHKEQDE